MYCSKVEDKMLHWLEEQKARRTRDVDDNRATGRDPRQSSLGMLG